MKFSVFQVSRKGGRAQNEDRMGYCYTRDAAVFILADGMGGHPEGEVAAQFALRTVADYFLQQAQPELPDVGAFLSEALLAAHRQILRYGTDRGMLDCPRTTLVVVVVQAGKVSWTHCGDSRFYLLRSDALLVRTRDHSLVEQSISRPPDARVITRLNRNVLFTCLGSPTRPIFKVEGPVPLQRGDRLMLCSDGLWSNLPENDIVLDLCRDPVAKAVPDLVEKALRQNGASSDNVTCLALEWETPDNVDATSTGAPTQPVSAAHADAASAGSSGWLDTLIEPFDDAAIERSVQKINAAIRRSTENNH